MGIIAIEHVQLAMPPEQEDRARMFYEQILGIPEVPKPKDLANRGGVWFERGPLKVHLGVEENFVAAKKAHPAFLVSDLADMVEHMKQKGIEIIEDNALNGCARVYVSDPFGNRIELMESLK